MDDNVTPINEAAKQQLYDSPMVYVPTPADRRVQCLAYALQIFAQQPACSFVVGDVIAAADLIEKYIDKGVTS